MSEHTIILYYKYVSVENPNELCEDQRSLCAELGLTGRIIVAKEGVNGTLEGKTEDIEQYCATLARDPRFADIEFKKSDGTGSAFPKLSIKVRDEIVSSYLDGVDPNEGGAPYIDPDELQQWYEDGKDFYVLDMRNDYEVDVGCFEKTVRSGMKHFRDVRSIPENLRHLNDKPVVSVCTGGVRCEKATAHVLKESGLKNVYQLKGGIDQYIKKYPGQHFKGKLYVFDGRVVMDTASSEVVGRCEFCGEECERYVNCDNDGICHRHFICCASCSDKRGRKGCRVCQKERVS